MAGPRRKIVEGCMADARLNLLLHTLARVVISVELNRHCRFCSTASASSCTSTRAAFSYATRTGTPCGLGRSAASPRTYIDQARHRTNFFDVEGVQATVRQLWSRDAAEICDGLLDAVVQHAAGPLPDDATIVVAKFTE